VTVSLEPNSEFSLTEENGQAQPFGVAFVRIKNIGQTPARNIRLWTATLSANKETALETLKSFADADRSEVHKDEWARYTLFPGEERVAKELVRMNRPRDPFGYCFAGLVGYRHSLESEPCHTTFSFTLFRKGPLYSKLLTLEQAIIPTAEIDCALTTPMMALPLNGMASRVFARQSESLQRRRRQKGPERPGSQDIHGELSQ
jgi:hypothetical protein